MVMNKIDNIIKLSGLSGEKPGKPVLNNSAGLNSGAKIKAGLALGSGAVRGFAHIGVISELIKNGVDINELSGSSMGAIVACLYASGMDMASMKNTALELCGDIIFDRRVPIISVNKGEKLKKYLKSLFWSKLKVHRLEELQTNVFVVCVDINRGRPVVFKSGDIIEALMASSAVPMLFPPYSYLGETYIDGGVLMPLPAVLLKKRRNEIVIGVSVGFSNMIKQPRHILHISAQSIVMMGEKILSAQKKEPDILIEPDFAEIGFWEFSKAENIIQIGRSAAIKALPRILNVNSNIERGGNCEGHVLNINSI